MELRTLLGRGQLEETATGQELTGPAVMSVQELQRLCETCVPPPA